jgi:hypothetical protein
MGAYGVKAKVPDTILGKGGKKSYAITSLKMKVRFDHGVRRSSQKHFKTP